MSALGWIHTIFGLVALAAGTAVLLIHKDSRWHRTLGTVYLSTMIGLNVTALFIYNQSGQFGPFHWLAVGSLLTVVAGMVPVFTQRPEARWLEWHIAFINGSYVGLVAATLAEIINRLPSMDISIGPIVPISMPW